MFSPLSIQIYHQSRELKEVDHWKCVNKRWLLYKGNRDDNWTIAIAKHAFNRIISLLINKLNIELRRNWLGVMFGAIASYGSKTWTPRKLEKYLGSYEMCWWRRMEKIKWSEKVTNEEIHECKGEKRTLLNNILLTKANWFPRTKQ